MTSVRGGYGVWKFTVERFQAMLTHAGFEVLENDRPPEDARKRFPWYCALAAPADPRDR